MHKEGLNTEAGMIRLLPGARQQVLRESERAKVAYVSANCVLEEQLRKHDLWVSGSSLYVSGEYGCSK